MNICMKMSSLFIHRIELKIAMYSTEHNKHKRKLNKHFVRVVVIVVVKQHLQFSDF